jgi:hypothetical protein
MSQRHQSVVPSSGFRRKKKFHTELPVSRPRARSQYSLFFSCCSPLACVDSVPITSTEAPSSWGVKTRFYTCHGGGNRWKACQPISDCRFSSRHVLEAFRRACPSNYFSLPSTLTLHPSFILSGASAPDPTRAFEFLIRRSRRLSRSTRPLPLALAPPVTPNGHCIANPPKTGDKDF